MANIMVANLRSAAKSNSYETKKIAKTETFSKPWLAIIAIIIMITVNSAIAIANHLVLVNWCWCKMLS